MIKYCLTRLCQHTQHTEVNCLCHTMAVSRLLPKIWSGKFQINRISNRKLIQITNENKNDFSVLTFPIFITFLWKIIIIHTATHTHIHTQFHQIILLSLSVSIVSITKRKQADMADGRQPMPRAFLIHAAGQQMVVCPF